MSKRTIVAVVSIVIVAAVLWFGGQALVSAFIAMHHRG